MTNSEREQGAERILSELNLPIRGSIAEGFTVLNEMYVNLLAGGFKAEESLWIIAYAIFGTPGNMRPQEDD